MSKTSIRLSRRWQKHPAAAREPVKRGTRATAAPGSGWRDSSGISSKSKSDPRGYDHPRRPPPPGCCCGPGEVSTSLIPRGAEHLSRRWYGGGHYQVPKIIRERLSSHITHLVRSLFRIPLKHPY